ELLSGNTAGYVLDPGGNLFQQTGAGLVLRDTGVRDYTAPGGQLYDLHTDGRVLQFANNVPTQVLSSASALVSDAPGDVFALSWYGTAYEHIRGTTNGWTPVGSGYRSLVSDATGNIFGLVYNGGVERHTLGAGWSWGQVGAGYRSLVSDI